MILPEAEEYYSNPLCVISGNAGMRSPAARGPVRLTATPRASRRGMCVLFLVVLLVGGASGSFVIPENSVLLPSSSDYRAYENSWTVNFDNVNAVDFDILIVEVCRGQPCPVQLEAFSGLVDCDALVRTFNDSAWYNHYISSQIASSSSLLCNNMHSGPDEVQMEANVILQDSDGRPWVILRQPLALEVVNDQDLLSRWGHEINSTDVGINTSRPVYEIVLRITQVLKLQRVFALHQSLVRVVVVTPTPSSMIFSVQNPCAARGYVAPEFGGVTLKEVNRRERCIWTCRVDLLRQPYNSVPPTREQLNSSHPDFAGVDPKYACLELPKDWAAVFFGFEIDTHMIATSDEYTQVLYDALDHMARGIQKEFANEGKAVLVALAVHDSVYHPQRFREQLREKAEAKCLLMQCENRWFPDAQGWTNRYFVYAETRRGLRNESRTTEYTAPSMISILYRRFLQRFAAFDFGGGGSAVGQETTLRSLVHGPFPASFAHAHATGPATPPRVPKRIASSSLAGQRRRTMSLHSLKIDGVVISGDLGVLTEDSERLQLITDIRDSVYSQGEMLLSFSASLQISRVEDFDISSVVGFVTPQAIPAAKNPPNPVNYWASNYIIIIVSISLIITGVMLLVCALLIRDVLANRRRRYEDNVDSY